MSPLWCAAVANKLDIVKILISHGALVNSPSDTESTPVRSACYMTNIEVVKYLVDNGADLHKPNVNGGTCLINSVQSVELCNFLIDKGADVNAQDNSGNLALHYAIREGRFETVRLLLDRKSDPYVKNDFGDDAIQTAALRGHAEIFEYLMGKVKPSKIRRIEANELMGANYVDEKHDLQKAIQLWREAMVWRHEDDDNKLSKPVLTPCHAYQHATEPRSLAELEERAVVPDNIYMQALLVRERILGPDHKDTVFGLMYRGAVYADTHRYQRCIDLWKYAFCLRHRKFQPLNQECLFTLQALCKLFWEIHEEQSRDLTTEKVQIADVMDVLEMSVVEIEMGQRIQGNHGDEFHMLMQLTIHVMHLLCVLLKCGGKGDEKGDSCGDERYLNSLNKLVSKLVRMKPRGKNNETLLHLAVSSKNNFINDEFYSDLPNSDLIDVLLKCGSFVNARDNDGNIALHLIECSNLADETNHVQDMVMMLIEHGAHVDACNLNGKVACANITKNHKYSKWFVPSQYISLKCLCAKQVKKCKIAYVNEVPQSLIPFIEIH